MTSADQPDPAPSAEAAELQGEMDTELAGLREKTAGPVTSRLNPVFQHEQRAGTAADEGAATETAVRVTGEIAAEADQERLKIEAQLRAIERAAPGSDRAADAQAAEAQADRDADGAVAASLDSDAAAEDAHRAEGTGLFHRGADPEGATADKAKALADEAVAARDLADLDALETRVSGDGA